MKIWKRIGAMAMVTAFSALALTGCGAGGSSSDRKLRSVYHRDHQLHYHGVRDLHGSQTAEPRKENVRETGSSGSCYGEGMPVLQNKNQYPCDTLSALYIRAGRQIVFSGR